MSHPGVIRSALRELDHHDDHNCKDDQNGHNSALQGFKRRDVVSEHGSATRDREVRGEDAQLCRPAQKAQGGLGDDLEDADDAADADDDSDSALDADDSDVKIVL